jgi:hypothetical protein
MPMPSRDDLIALSDIETDPEFMIGGKGPKPRQIADMMKQIDPRTGQRRTPEEILVSYELPDDRRRVYVSRTQLRALLAPRPRIDLSAPPPQP